MRIPIQRIPASAPRGVKIAPRLLEAMQANRAWLGAFDKLKTSPKRTDIGRLFMTFADKKEASPYPQTGEN